ncbi:ABC transporter permease [Treponema sp. OMZ 840]|uniref:ABC transporter permease n=1 Tax=Treponema sp. OMZ 840 TaxID=244313 RepID=UPI003D91FC35
MNKILSILKKREATLSIIILLLGIFVSIRVPSFFTYENICNVLKSYSVVGIFSLGVLLVIIGGGFDVSFSAIAQVSQYLVVWLLLKHIHGNLFIAFILAIAIGTLMGLFNGFLIDHYKMPAIIITISTQNLFYGILYVVSKGKLLYEVPSYIWPLSNTKIFAAAAENGSIYGLSTVTVLWFALSVLFAFILHKSVIGRSVYLVGGNALAAQRVGINVRKTILFVYGLSGAIAGVASIAHVSIIQTVIPNSIVGTEMSVIAAVVLGGASITGGKGSVLGTFLGVLLFAILSNSLTLLRISSYWYNVFTGAIILLSIAVNALQELAQARRKIRVKVD